MASTFPYSKENCTHPAPSCHPSHPESTWVRFNSGGEWGKRVIGILRGAVVMPRSTSFSPQDYSSRRTPRAAGCPLELDLGISYARHVHVELKDSHAIQVLSSEQREACWGFLEEFVMSPYILGERHVKWRHSSSRDFSGQETHKSKGKL